MGIIYINGPLFGSFKYQYGASTLSMVIELLEENLQKFRIPDMWVVVLSIFNYISWELKVFEFVRLESGQSDKSATVNFAIRKFQRIKTIFIPVGSFHSIWIY